MLKNILTGIAGIFFTTAAFGETIIFQKEAGLRSTVRSSVNDLIAPNFPPLPADSTFTEPFDARLGPNEARFFRYDFELPEGYSNLSFELQLNVDDEFAVYINDTGIAMQDDTGDENFEDPLPGFVFNADGSSIDTSAGKLDYLSIDHTKFHVGKNEMTILVSDTLVDGSFDVLNGKVAFDTFTINPGMNDAWYNPVTPGQGFLISVFPDIQQMFVAWFTYDIERPPKDIQAILGDSGHRWLTAQGPYIGGTANLTIYVTEGGVFDASDPPAVTDAEGDGSLTIEFADCNAALATYVIDSINESGEIPLERIVLDNVPTCEALSRP